MSSKKNSSKPLLSKEDIAPEILDPIDKGKELLSWEIQPRESAEAYQLFQDYIFMGPRRSLEKIAVKHDVSYSGVAQLSSRWGWRERLRAYLAYENKQKMAIDEELNLERFRVYQEIIEEARGLFLEEALSLSKQLIGYAKGYVEEFNEDTGEVERHLIKVDNAKVRACVEALNRAGINPPKEININVESHMRVKQLDKKKFEDMSIDEAKRSLAAKMGSLKSRDE